MNKLCLAFVLAALFAGCGTLHDGQGWEHNMQDKSGSILEHKH